MPQADPFDAPAGGTLYGRLFETVTEAFAGNGVANVGDARVSVGTADFDVDVNAATGLRYGGDTYDAAAVTLTVDPPPTTTTDGAEDRRVDMVVFDSDTGSYDLLTGASSPYPSPPPTPSNALMIALVEVEHSVESITNTDILNWRAQPSVVYPVVTDDIQDDAVTESKVADGAITTAQMALGAVDTEQLADGAVTEAKINEEVTTTISIQSDGEVISPEVSTINFGRGLEVTDEGDGRVSVEVDEDVLGSDEPLAQALSRRANDLSATRIEEASGVSARKAQVLARRA